MPTMQPLLAEINYALEQGPVFVGGLSRFCTSYLVMLYQFEGDRDVSFIEAVFFDTSSEEPLMEIRSLANLTRVVSFSIARKTTKMRPVGLTMTINSGSENKKIEFGFLKSAY